MNGRFSFASSSSREFHVMLIFFRVHFVVFYGHGSDHVVLCGPLGSPIAALYRHIAS